MKALTGGCHNTPGDRRRRVDCGIVNHETIASSRARRLMIPSLPMSIDDSLPTDLARAHALIVAQRQALSAAELRAAAAESEAQYRALLIEKVKFTIRKLRHDRPFSQSLMYSFVASILWLTGFTLSMRMRATSRDISRDVACIRSHSHRFRYKGGRRINWRIGVAATPATANLKLQT